MKGEELFKVCKEGNENKLKKLLNSTIISIHLNSVDEERKWTALHYCCSWNLKWFNY